MRETLRVKYYLYINNMSIMIMNGINEIGRKSPSIANKIVSIGGKIKLSISNLSINVRNTINEFIHPSRYENKIIFSAKSTFLKSKDLIISNEEVNNINNEMIESNRIDNETIESNRMDNEKNTLKERLQILKDIELPNGDLVPIDEAINDLYLCKQDSLLNSKLSLIDYITDMQFKSSTKNKVELSSKLDDNLNILNSKGGGEYVKCDNYENTKFNNYENIKFDDYENIKFDNYENVNFNDYKNGEIAMTDSQYYNINNDYLIMTKLKNIDKDMSNEVNPNINESIISLKKEDFKSRLIEITKDVSLLDRLSDDNDRYGYVFLDKVINYLENYNKNKEPGKADPINKETYFKKLANSDYFFKLNKKINNIIYLQYLKKEQSAYENGIAEKIIATANNTLNENLSKSFIDEIDEQLNIANENKNLTLQELLAKVKK